MTNQLFAFKVPNTPLYLKHKAKSLEKKQKQEHSHKQQQKQKQAEAKIISMQDSDDDDDAESEIDLFGDYFLNDNTIDIDSNGDHNLQQIEFDDDAEKVEEIPAHVVPANTTKWTTKPPPWTDLGWNIVDLKQEPPKLQFHLNSLFLGEFETKEKFLQVWYSQKLWQYFTPMFAGKNMDCSPEKMEQMIEEVVNRRRKNVNITPKDIHLSTLGNLLEKDEDHAVEKKIEKKKKKKGKKTDWYCYTRSKTQQIFIGWYRTSKKAMEEFLKQRIYYSLAKLQQIENDKLKYHQDLSGKHKIENGIGYIFLLGGGLLSSLNNNGETKNKTVYAKVDLEDFEKCKNITWVLFRGIAYNKEFGGLNDYILSFYADDIVTFRNSKEYDFRKKIIAKEAAGSAASTNEEAAGESRLTLEDTKDLRNLSGQKGVSFSRKTKKWTASIWLDQKDYIFLGSYFSLTEAINARKHAERLALDLQIRAEEV
jgi:hypothetical protein